MSRRVLFVTPWYPTSEHPVAGVFVREHAKAAAGFADVRIVHLLPRAGSKAFRVKLERDESLTEGVPVYRASYPDVGRGTSLVCRSVALGAALRRARRDGFRPDVLHAHVFLAGAAAVIAGRVSRIPVVVTEHFTAFARDMLTRWDVAQARIAFSGAQLVLPVSLALQRSIERYRVRARFRVVPNVVDTELFMPADDFLERPPVRLAFVGLLNQVKGVDILIAALAILRREGRAVTLEVIGDGPERGRLQELASRLSLDGLVLFRGVAAKPEVAAALRKAHIAVVPSRFETFGVVAAEALATGIPVVVTASGGPEEFVTPDNGWTVEPGDAQGLAVGIARVSDRLDSYDRFEIAARARSQFGPAAVGSALASIYDEVSMRPAGSG